MSLIQEALKRKLEEKSGAAPAASPPPAPLTLASSAPVSTPPPAPVQSGMTVQQEESGGGNTAKIVGMVAAIVVMVGVALALIFMAAKSWSNKDSGHSDRAAAPAQSRPPPHAQAESGPESVSQPANPLASITERVTDMKSKVIESRNEGAEITGDTPPAPTPRAAPVASAPPVQAPVARPEPAAPSGSGGSSAIVQSQEFSLWPRITVNGILSKGTRGRGMAIINNQMMSVNESLDGVRLVEVRAQGVMMEFGGESRFIETGQTIQ